LYICFIVAINIFIFNLLKDPNTTPGTFGSMYGVAIDSTGRVWVSDANFPFVQAFDGINEYRSQSFT